MSSQSTPGRPVRLLITGGIGSGKSTVGTRLAELGADVVDADIIGHQILEPGREAHSAVADRWPEAVSDGRVDRGALAAIVFSDAEQLRALERITHPLIAAEIRRRVARSDRPVVAVELPIGIDLFGPGWTRVVVEAPQDERVRRAVARGFSESDVLRRMRAQPDVEEGRSGGDYVIVNDGTKEELLKAVDELWEELIESRESRVESRDPVE